MFSAHPARPFSESGHARRALNRSIRRDRAASTQLVGELADAAAIASAQHPTMLAIPAAGSHGR